MRTKIRFLVGVAFLTVLLIGGAISMIACTHGSAPPTMGTSLPVTSPAVTSTPAISPEVTFTPVISPAVTSTPAISPAVTSTPVISPAVTSTPTVSPGVTSTPAIFPMVTATPATSVSPQRHPVTWTVWTVKDPNGKTIGIVDDPGVRAAVVQGFLDAFEWLYEPDLPQNPADVTRYFAPLPDSKGDWVFQPDPKWWLGLDEARRHLAVLQENHVLLRSEVDGEWDIKLARFSPDGQRAVVRAQRGGQCRTVGINTLTGEQILDQKRECHLLYVTGMLYDPSDGRWKIAVMRLFTEGG